MPVDKTRSTASSHNSKTRTIKLLNESIKACSQLQNSHHKAPEYESIKRYKDGGESYHTGDSPDARMTTAAAKRGVILEGASRPLRPADLDDFDLVVGMVSE